MVDEQHRQYPENRNRERDQNRPHTNMPRMIQDHSNTLPDVSLERQ
jgi:hypothetical protein